MNREPTVLDFVKSLFRGKPLAIPHPEEAPRTPPVTEEQRSEQPVEEAGRPVRVEAAGIRSQAVSFPWRSMLALGIALVAQISLMPRANRAWVPGVILYAMAAGWLAWSTWRGECLPAELPEPESRAEDSRVRSRWL